MKRRERLFVLIHNQRTKFFNELISNVIDDTEVEVHVFSNRNQHWVNGLAKPKNAVFCSLNFSDLEKREIKSDINYINTVIKCAEKAVGISAKRILMTDERKWGSGFRNGSWSWFDDPIAKKVEQNPSLASNILIKAFDFWLEKIHLFGPNKIILGHASGVFAGSLFFLSKSIGVDVYINRRSKILNDRFYWTSDWLEQNKRGLKLASHLLGEKNNPTKRSLDFIRRFKEKPAPIAYISQNWRIAQSSLIKKMRLYIGASRALLLFKFGLIKGDEPIGPFVRIKADLRAFINLSKKRRFVSDLETAHLETMQYVYFPLHKEPELALNKLCPMWHDQMHLVRWISSNLPNGYKLIVKDHRFNDGRRRPEFYQSITKLPDVHLVRSDYNQYDLIRFASIVLSINGSSAFEAKIFNIPTIYLGNTFYDVVGNASKLDNTGDLGDAIKLALSLSKLPQKQRSDREVACLVEAEYLTTFRESMVGEKNYIYGSINKYLQLSE